MHDFCWVEMVTDDRKAAQAFYGRLFGWEFEELERGDLYMGMAYSPKG